VGAERRRKIPGVSISSGDRPVAEYHDEVDSLRRLEYSRRVVPDLKVKAERALERAQRDLADAARYGELVERAIRLWPMLETMVQRRSVSLALRRLEPGSPAYAPERRGDKVYQQVRRGCILLADGVTEHGRPIWPAADPELREWIAERRVALRRKQ